MYHFKKQSLLFKRALYLTVLVSCLYWLWDFELLFGSGSIVYKSQKNYNSWRDVAFLAYFKPSLAKVFIIVSAFICAFCILSTRASIVTDLLLFFMVLNLHYAIYPGVTGGDFLLNQFLLFNAGLSFQFSEKENALRQFRKWLHNLGVITIMIQVCFLYLISGLTKITDPSWRNGEAIQNVMSIRHFSLWDSGESGIFAAGLFKVLNYLVIFYQLSFPILVWIKKLKKPLLITGVLMHLYIAIVMGLLGFGLLMLLSYIYFWPLEQEKA